MTVRFLALYETSAGSTASDRHYREVHISHGAGCAPAVPIRSALKESTVPVAYGGQPCPGAPVRAKRVQ